METIETSHAAIEIASFSICVFALILSVAQLRLMAAYSLLACLFLTLSLSDLFDVATILSPDMAPGIATRLFALSYVAAFLVPPTLLFYVRALTDQSLSEGRGETMAHLALPALAVLSTPVLILSSGDNAAVADQGEALSGVAAFVVQSLILLPFAFYVQCLIYAALAMRAQMQHRERLKDLFASTEPHEVRWINVMAALFATFAILNLLSLVAAVQGEPLRLPPVLDSFLELLIVLVLGVWGLRQTPGLSSLSADTGEHRDTTHIKYEKSALDAQRAERIASKLQIAMERDELFRDANLSLMGLAQHVGVTTNYVSQTLNAQLGVSFFDFVNHWRVEASKPIIEKGGRPITLIAYEVGFNSRSSFYTAFKKNTGMTPSQYHAETHTRVPETG